MYTQYTHVYMYTQYTLPTFLWFLVSQFNSDFDLAAFDSWIRFYLNRTSIYCIVFLYLYSAAILYV